MSKNQRDLFRSFRRGIHGLGVALVLFAQRPEACAQLAITEVMSAGSLSGGLQRPDFWEITNFGTNEVNLAGYRWGDAGEVPFESRSPMPATTIRPAESIIFVRFSNAFPDPTAFRTWWGTNLPIDLKIYNVRGAPGFDASNGDAVRLWDVNANLIDEVWFGLARLGVTFTYETNFGTFSEFSEEGVAGAFRSADGADIGSPGYGTNKGPVALRITQQPVSQTVNSGSEIILKVSATGRPGPRYHWYFNGGPVPAAGTVSSVPRLVCFADCGPSWRLSPGPNDLALPGIQPGQSGNYSVEIFNGLERLTSAVATVTVNTNPSPIQVECPPGELCVPCAGTNAPGNLVASPGQTAIFTVGNRGFPLPTFQWSHSTDGVNFTDLPGQTSRDLAVSNLEDSDAGLYRVRLVNALGSTTAVARLTVKPSPQLEITEVMSEACSALDRDWWELTNTNAEPVNFCGYRWDDETARVGEVITIGGGPTITNNVIVQPGESVILLESQTAESFIQWWGASNLPPKLKFITYAANGLGGELGDQIYLWDPNETDGLRFVARADFSTAPPGGATRWFDYGSCSEFGVASDLGSCGTFQAEQGCATEIGSPGWTRWTPPTLTSVRREGAGTVISWKAQPGSINQVQFARQLAIPLDATVWEELGQFQFTRAACLATDSTIGAEPQRFYRAMRVAAANCPCPE